MAMLSRETSAMEGSLELEGLESAEPVASATGKGRPVVWVEDVGLGGGYDRLRVGGGERLCKSLADKVLVEVGVDGGHLDDARGGGELSRSVSMRPAGSRPTCHVTLRVHGGYVLSGA